LLALDYGVIGFALYLAIPAIEYVACDIDFTAIFSLAIAVFIARVTALDDTFHIYALRGCIWSCAFLITGATII
jgi:hypothetical protein